MRIIILLIIMAFILGCQSMAGRYDNGEPRSKFIKGYKIIIDPDDEKKRNEYCVSHFHFSGSPHALWIEAARINTGEIITVDAENINLKIRRAIYNIGQIE